MKKTTVVILCVLGLFILSQIGWGVYKVTQEITKDKQESILRAHDAQRRAELNDVSNALFTYHEQKGSFPIQTTCTTLNQIGVTLPSLDELPKDPKAEAAQDGYDPSWPDYCYQSDESGTKFIVWAKTESERNKTISEIFRRGDPLLPAPTPYLPNAFFVQSSD